MASTKAEKGACPVLDFEGTNCPACGAPKASHIAAREDYVTTVCGGCDRPKAKCTCSDGDCG